MIYLLYGDDTLSLEEKLESLRATADDPYGMNITTLDGASVSPSELEAAWSAAPFLSDKRIVVVRGLLGRFEQRRRRSTARSERSLGVWKDIADRLANVPETTSLIFTDGSVNQAQNPLFKAIRPLSQVLTFRLPSARQMPQWIGQRANKLGADIEPPAIAVLADTIGNDTRVVDMELQKLALYRDGERIRRQDVEAIVSYVREASIFTAVDAVLEGRTAPALRMVHQILDDGSPPAYIIIMLARQVRLLILAKDLKAKRLPQDEIGRRMSISGFPLTKTLQLEVRFTAERLRHIHRRLLETDLAIKTGAADEQMALDTLIATLASTSQRRL